MLWLPLFLGFAGYLVARFVRAGSAYAALLAFGSAAFCAFGAMCAEFMRVFSDFL